jgi:signal transduction histidine kinase
MNQSRENALRVLMDALPHGVVLIDDQNTVAAINPSALRLLGLRESAEAIGLPFLKLVKPAGEAAHDAIPLLEIHELQRHTTLAAMSGMQFIAAHTTTAITWGGLSLRLFCFFDTSNTADTEARMKQMANFSELNPQPELRVDEQGTVNLANPAALEAFGPEIEKGNINELITKAADLNLQRIIASGRMQAISQVIDAQHYDFLFRGVPELRVAQIYGMEITERVLAEKAAHQEYAKLSAMISDMEEGVLFADVSDTICEANSFFCRFMDVERADLIGYPIYDVISRLMPDMAKEISTLITGFRDRGASALARVFQLQHGAADVIFRVQPIYRNAIYDGVLLNIVNVTDLVSARRQAEAANQAKSQFLANMSHELKTPLTVINGFAEVLLERTFGELNESQERYLQQIYDNGLQLLAIVADLLDIARIESGRMELHLLPQEITSLCREVKSSISPRLKSGVELIYDLPDKQVHAQVDILRMKQVLVNLLSNAAKFTDQGRITVWLEEQEANIKLGVSDTGIGIEQQHLEQLFRPFEQLQSKFTSSEKGTGLGLALCREIIQAHHGEIEVESELGAGSTFIITLPKAH